MKFLDLSKTLDEIESTTKRLEMVDLIASLLRRAEDDIKESVLLLQGKVAPDYIGKETGIAEMIAIRALSILSGMKETAIEMELIRKGDLGRLGEAVLENKKQASLFSEDLTVKKVYESFLRMSEVSGSGSQSRKIQMLLELLQNASSLEIRYILRIVTGKMRIGVADMTIVDSIAVAFATKDKSDFVEAAYNIMPDLPELAYRAMAGGIESLANIKITPGIPIRSMLAERLPTLDQILDKMEGRFAIEYKYDGLRTQVHKEGNKIDIFSRRLERITPQFPDIVKEIMESISAESIVLDGEAVPFNLETGEMLPFQEISKRRGRKYDLDRTIERIPVVVFFFDVLMLNGKSLMGLPYPQRRLKLTNSIKESEKIRIAKSMAVSDSDSAEKFFSEALEAGCEGIVAKSVEEKSIYKAGAREFLWIKYKRDYRMEMEDTVDLVIVGAFGGQGKRTGGYGALLMATYSKEDDQFRTVCKLGTGFTEDQLDNLPRMLKKYSIHGKDRRVVSNIKADFWFTPAVLLEVKGAEITISPTHSCCNDIVKKGTGLAIRFPRFTGRWRTDKKPDDATSEEEILEMYHSQRKKAAEDNP